MAYRRRFWLRLVASTPRRIDDVLDAPGDKVVVLNHMWGRGRGTGVEVEMELNLVYTVTDRQITRLEGYYTSDEALRAAGLSE